MNDHLRAVSEAGNEPVDPTDAGRAQRRPRTDKPLPTDRMKMATQKEALKAIAVASNYGAQAVSALDIAPRLGLKPATAGLNNAFFVEAGLIERVSKGHYRPTKATRTYARKASFNEAEAATLLAPALRESWYFREVTQQLAMGPTTTKKMVEVLAHAAGASADHAGQLEMVLQWLEYVGLVVLAGGYVQIGQHDLQALEAPADEPANSDEPKEPVATKGEVATTQVQQESSVVPSEATLLSLNFDFALTAEDLRKLEPEQITALFEAVGKVVAIKATKK
jgi:hypothetical protein